MSRRPIARSDDLRRLEADGFTLSVAGAKLVVRDIPFVDSEGAVHDDGVLVMPLTLAGDVVEPPGDHTASFAGGIPCDSTGRKLTAIINGEGASDLGNGIIAVCTFSMKPTTNAGKYPDFHQKVTKYVAAISSPVADLDPDATARRHLPVETDEDDDTPFRYLDTASSRAGIDAVNERLRDERVGIVGLGGTGEYILDFVAKTLSPEIHVFDGDEMLTHNAFRAPGAPTLEQLNAKPLKVEHFAGIYGQMHKGIVTHPYDITADSIAELLDLTFVFLSIDDAEAKAPIIEGLVAAGVPFIDVGMGIELVNGHLTGIVRTTTVTPEHNAHVDTIPTIEGGDEGEYRSNIQIAELNARNAADAVIRWKKYRGVYADLGGEHTSSLKVATNHVINTDRTDEPDPDACE